MAGVDLEVELLSSPLRWTTYSPEGTSLNVTRKMPLSSGWRAQPEIGVTFINYIEPTMSTIRSSSEEDNINLCQLGN